MPDAALIADRRRFLQMALAGGAVGLLPGCAAAMTEAPRASQALPLPASFPNLDQFLAQFVRSNRLPGVVASIGAGVAPPRILAHGRAAMDSRVAVDGDTLWRLYSMTKPVTGIAAMMLIDRGRLTLDTPIADVLPAFRDMRVLASADAPLDRTVPLARPITVRHLLTHTAGLGYGIAGARPIDRAWQERGLVPAQVSKLSLPGRPNIRTIGPLARWADEVAKLPLLAQPGTRWSYSASLDLLGRVIEVVSGRAFDRFLADEIFGPLGMRSTSFRVAPADRARFVTAYAPLGGVLMPVDPASDSIYSDAPSFPFGGAGLVSSARDYDRFLMMLAGHGAIGRTRILSDRTARLAMSDLLAEGTDTRATFVAGQGFGAGGRVSRAGAPEGAGVFGWAGAAGAIAFVDPNRGLRFGAYANYLPAEAYDFQRRAPEMLLADLAGRPVATPAAAARR